MKFLLDESAELRLAAYLREQGHDVTAVAVHYPASIKDQQVLAIAQVESRVLITNDTDFGELVFKQRQPHSGVILFRFSDLPLSDKIAALQQLLAEHPDELTDFVVVAPGSVRIRSVTSKQPGHRSRVSRLSAASSWTRGTTSQFAAAEPTPQGDAVPWSFVRRIVARVSFLPT